MDQNSEFGQNASYFFFWYANARGLFFFRKKGVSKGQRYYSSDREETYKKREQWPGIELRT
jgi:hypothetical protein